MRCRSSSVGQSVVPSRPPGAVHGLDRGLELEPTQLSARVRGPQVLVCPADQARVPQGGVLFGERDETPARVNPRRCACRRELDQGREPPGLRIGGNERGEHFGEVQRLRGQLTGLRSGRPVDDIGTVDRLKDRGHPRREVRPVRNAEGNAGGLDAFLRPDQTRRHRRRWHREGPPDLLGGEAEHRVEHERRAHRAFDRRVRAHEHQFKPPVRDRVDVNVIDMRQWVQAVIEGDGPLRPRGLPLVAQPVAGDGQQPRVGAAGHPLRRPRPQGPLECVGKRVLRRGEVTRGGRKQGEQPAVAVAGRHARGAGRRPRLTLAGPASRLPSPDVSVSTRR